MRKLLAQTTQEAKSAETRRQTGDTSSHALVKMSVAKAKLVDNADDEELEQGDDNFLMQDRKTDRKLIGVLLTTFSGGIAAGIIAASMATVYMYHYGFNQYESPHGPFATKNGFPVYENVRMGIALYHVLASFLCLLPGCSFLSTIEKKTSVAARKVNIYF